MLFFLPRGTGLPCFRSRFLNKEMRTSMPANFSSQNLHFQYTFLLLISLPIDKMVTGIELEGKIYSFFIRNDITYFNAGENCQERPSLKQEAFILLSRRRHNLSIIIKNKSCISCKIYEYAN